MFVNVTFVPLNGLLSVLALCASVTAQSSYHRYYFKQRLELQVDPERVAVHCPMGRHHVEHMLSATGVAHRGIEAWPIDGWYLVQLAEPSSGAISVARLAEADSVAAPFFAAPVFVDALGGPLVPTEDLIVGFDPALTDSQVRDKLAAIGGFDEARPDWAGMTRTYRLHSTRADGISVLDQAGELAQDERVLFAEPDFVFSGRGELTPNDPGFTSEQLWGLHNTGQSGGVFDMDVDAPEAWNVTTGNSSVVVVIIDTGVQLGHPDLHAGQMGVDQTGDNGGGNPVNSCDSHGTAVAGCIAARINNNLGTVGVAPNCRIASARAFQALPACDGSWITQASWTVDALAWAETIGARVTNNSNVYGFTWSAIDAKYASSKANGLVHFASAGNAGAQALTYPASLPSVNAVAAIDRMGAAANFAGGCVNGNGSTNGGLGLAFCAPGEDIYTTDRGGSAGYVSGDYACVDGTSFASPYAAGVAALVLSRDPALAPPQVENVMRQSCTDLGVPGYDSTFGWGLVNARKALDPAGSIELVGTISSFAWPDKPCENAEASLDGRYVVFESRASNLLPDVNGSNKDVYRRDRVTGALVYASTTNGTTNANNGSSSGSISDDGRCVAFRSTATNLVSGDTNANNDVFVRDMVAGVNQRVSVATGGAQAIVSPTGSGSGAETVRISGNGRWIAFDSEATNFVTPSPPSGSRQLYVHDRLTVTTHLVTRTLAGSPIAGFVSGRSDISDDGSWVVFAASDAALVSGDTNGVPDMFVWNRTTGSIQCISRGPGGFEADAHSLRPSLSGDGRFAAFRTYATNLGVYNPGGSIAVVWDRLTSTLSPAAVTSTGAMVDCSAVAISSNGRFTAFTSSAGGVVPGDTWNQADLFLHDRHSGSVSRVTIAANGAESNGDVDDLLSVSDDGSVVTFESDGTDLLSIVDGNGTDHDIFARTFAPAGGSAPAVYCAAKTNSLGCVPAIGFVGTPSATSVSPFTVRATSVVNQKNGLLFYGLAPQSTPFQGGWMCVHSPLQRMSTQVSGGSTSGSDCTGEFQLDFNAHIRAGTDPRLVASTLVFCEYWYRDPQSASTTGLSDALRFVIAP